MKIIDLGKNTFLFNLKDDVLPTKLLEEAPWNILGNILSIQRWIPEIAGREVYALSFLGANPWATVGMFLCQECC